MRSQEVEVQADKKVVAVLTVEIFETVQEATDHLGEAVALSLINTQHKTTKMNLERQKATKKVTQKQLYNEAVALLAAEDNGAKLIASAGNPAEMQVLIDEKMGALREKYGLANPEA
tara:strand:- start:647 stop:997 length:351 start_codon:yes stop_codon:yes gene_type:complete